VRRQWSLLTPTCTEPAFCTDVAYDHTPPPPTSSGASGAALKAGAAAAAAAAAGGCSASAASASSARSDSSIGGGPPLACGGEKLGVWGGGVQGGMGGWGGGGGQLVMMQSSWQTEFLKVHNCAVSLAHSDHPMIQSNMHLPVPPPPCSLLPLTDCMPNTHAHPLSNRENTLTTPTASCL
jgi:hypothetical protein